MSVSKLKSPPPAVPADLAANGHAPAVDAGPDAAAIEAWLVQRLAKLVGCSREEIDVEEPLTSYGLGSRQAVSLSSALERWLKRELPPTLAYDYPTVAELTRYLAAGPDA